MPSGGYYYLRNAPARIENETLTEPEPEPEVTPESEDDKGKDKEPKAVEAEVTDDDDDGYPDDGTIPEVKEWIGDDLDRAQTAYDREQEKSTPRSTLLDYLDSLLSENDDDDDA